MSTKPTNPKDNVGVRKWRQFAAIPMTVIAEVGAGFLEGSLKYARHNYREAGVRASIYVDAAIGHIVQWWEGEDLDPDTKLSHITKAICSLVVLRDAMIQDMLNDDRPPKAKLNKVRDNLQSIVGEMFDKYPEPKAPITELGMRTTIDAGKHNIGEWVLPAAEVDSVRFAPPVSGKNITTDDLLRASPIMPKYKPISDDWSV